MSKRSGNTLNSKTLVIGITLLAFVSVASLGYLWQLTQIHSLGRQMRQLEQDLENLQKTNDRLERAYAAMCSPRELDARVRKLNLGLAAPQPDQIVRMRDPSAEKEKAVALSPSEKERKN